MIIPVNLELTTAGLALMAKIGAGNGVNCKIIRVVAGAGISDDPLNLTGVVDPRQELTVTRQEAVGARSDIYTLLKNFDESGGGVTQGYEVTQVGFYAMDPDAGEILFRILQNDHPPYVPPYTQRPVIHDWVFNFVTGNACEIVINVDPAGIVSRNDLNRLIELSARAVPAVGTRLHMRVLGTAPGYVSQLPDESDVDKAYLSADDVGVVPGSLQLGGGDVLGLSFQQ